MACHVWWCLSNANGGPHCLTEQHCSRLTRGVGKPLFEFVMENLMDGRPFSQQGLTSLWICFFKYISLKYLAESIYNLSQTDRSYNELMIFRLRDCLFKEILQCFSFVSHLTLACSDARLAEMCCEEMKIGEKSLFIMTRILVTGPVGMAFRITYLMSPMKETMSCHWKEID